MPTFTAYVEYDPETKSYSAIVPGIPGAHTQGDTLDELRTNLQEVLELVLEDYDDDLPNFVGTMAIDVPVSEPGEQTANRKLQKDERSAA